METTTIQKFIHTSPRKLRLLADMVRKINPARSLDILKFTPKLAAVPLKKAIEAVLANSKASGMKADAAYFKSIEINEGPVIKRYRPASKGRALPFKRRMSHIKIILSDEIKEAK